MLEYFKNLFSQSNNKNNNMEKISPDVFYIAKDLNKYSEENITQLSFSKFRINTNNRKELTDLLQKMSSELSEDDLNKCSEESLKVLCLIQNDYAQCFDCNPVLPEIEKEEIKKNINKSLYNVLSANEKLLSENIKYLNGFNNVELIENLLNTPTISDEHKKRLIYNIKIFSRWDNSKNNLDEYIEQSANAFVFFKHLKESEIESMLNEFKDYFNDLNKNNKEDNETSYNSLKSKYKFQKRRDILVSLMSDVRGCKIIDNNKNVFLSLLNIKNEHELKIDQAVILFNKYLNNELNLHDVIDIGKKISLNNHDLEQYQKIENKDFISLNNYYIFNNFKDSDLEKKEKLNKALLLSKNIWVEAYNSYWVKKFEGIKESSFQENNKEEQIEIVKNYINIKNEIDDNIKEKLLYLLSDVKNEKDSINIKNIFQSEKQYKNFINKIYENNIYESSIKENTFLNRNLIFELDNMTGGNKEIKINEIINNEVNKYIFFKEDIFSNKDNSSSPFQLEKLFKLSEFYIKEDYKNKKVGIKNEVFEKIIRNNIDDFSNIDPNYLNKEQELNLIKIMNTNSCGIIMELINSNMSDEVFERFSKNVTNPLFNIEKERRMLNKEINFQDLPAKEVNVKKKRL